jgi:hypothetical protein
MATNQIIASNPPTVWQVPETFKSVYSHAVEVRDVNRLLMISASGISSRRRCMVSIT